MLQKVEKDECMLSWELENLRESLNQGSSTSFGSKAR
jgi:hypothetical protein